MSRVPTLIPELRAARAAGGPVAGVDEVGRGPIAGPVVAAAVILPVEDRPGWIHLLRDSKALLPERREWLAEVIQEEAIAVSIAAVSSAEIDVFGIAPATAEAMRRAVADLTISPASLLIDAFSIPGVTCSQHALVRGDARCVSIAAASIIAKVARDRLMCELDEVFPGYGFASHKGYGTPEHRAALRRLGPSPVHRRSFLGGSFSSGGSGVSLSDD